MGKNFGFLIVGVAAGFVLANILQRAEQEANESPEELMDSLDSKFKELETAMDANKSESEFSTN